VSSDDPDATRKRPALAPLDRPFRVTVVEGPDRGASIVVHEQAVLVGQSPVCALRLTDPAVSRRHASLDALGGALVVRDLGSTNGTFLDGVEVVEARARPDAVLRIGSTALAIAAATAAETAASHPPGSARPQPLPTTFGDVLGKSRAMLRVFPVLTRLAASRIPVLLEGETGTGKEVVARALHEHGARAKGPLIVFDCSAIAPNLVEAELFGHERGAFTGAAAQRKGVFEQAHGGTLFLDELGDLPLDLQARLLRAIERGEVRRLGGDAWIRCDVRIVAATRRDMDKLVEAGRFRDDLFHRLAVGRVELPPLRERREDVARLVARFTAEADPEAPPIPARVLAEWASRPWPGNVRELRNAVFRYVALGDLPVHDADAEAELPEASEGSPAPVVTAPGESEIDALLRLRLTYPEARDRLQRALERRYVAFVLAESGGSVQRAARLAGVAPRYLQILRARSG
jgi:DNA-binding NtrC family response regulator